MQDRWFTPYDDGNIWNEAIASKYGYSQLFVNTVELIRNWFRLWQTSDGREVGSKWVPYELGSPEDIWAVGVHVTNFRWNLYAYDEHGHPFIRFRLFVRLCQNDTKKVFANKEIIIEFPNNYPVFPPKFYTKDYKQYKGSEVHHTLQDGEYCILKRGKDWHKG